MTKIGFNVLAWSAGLPDALLPVTERLKEIGYDGVEFALDNQSQAVYKRFGNHLRATGLEVTCVMVVGPGENPVSESAAVRAKALDRLREAIDCTHALGSKIICGPFHSAFATFTRRAPEAVEYHRSIEVSRADGEHTAQAGVTLTPEALQPGCRQWKNTRSPRNAVMKGNKGFCVGILVGFLIHFRLAGIVITVCRRTWITEG
jgi:D-psicose/D-tagatose/L-ribulose 3-epimerase